MQTGYIFTERGADALRAFHEHAGVIRYAALLSDGRGLLAWDAEQVPVLERGTPYVVSFVWPWRAAPKRAVRNGRERFAIVSVDLVPDLARELWVAGMAQITDDLALIETDDHDVPMALWQASAIEALDVRDMARVTVEA